MVVSWFLVFGGSGVGCVNKGVRGNLFAAGNRNDPRTQDPHVRDCSVNKRREYSCVNQQSA